MTIKLVIFDFDGTIVDSKRAYYESIKKHIMPLGFGIKEIDKSIAIGLSLSETLRKFIPRMVTRWMLKRAIMQDVIGEIDDVKKCHDVSFIKEIRHRKILVSNSLSDFVYPVLRRLGLRKEFSEIHCADEFGDKGEFIKMYLKIHGIRPWECFYIGDRVADIKLAKKLGLHNIIISGKCAWDSKKEIMNARPEFLIPDLKDVKRIVEKFRA